MRRNVYRFFVKRLLDILLSTIGIVVLFPVYILLAVAIKIDSPGPVFFKQTRIGIHKSHFVIIKFRTMKITAPKETPTHLLENPESYVTNIGKFMRKTSLDELPQIFQIFSGKMSVIGLRPALWNQYDLIAERDIYDANDVRPGLTGWAQINGRDELAIGEKAKLDGEYVKRMSLIFDARCFLTTIRRVTERDGIAEGKAK